MFTFHKRERGHNNRRTQEVSFLSSEDSKDLKSVASTLSQQEWPLLVENEDRTGKDPREINSFHHVECYALVMLLLLAWLGTCPLHSNTLLSLYIFQASQWRIEILLLPELCKVSFIK